MSFRLADERKNGGLLPAVLRISCSKRWGAPLRCPDYAAIKYQQNFS